MVTPKRVFVWAMVATALGLCGYASGQTSSPCPTQVVRTNPAASSDLVCLVPQVYGAGGLVGVTNGGPLSDTTNHAVHFQASSLRSFGPINSEIGVQLTQLPISAPSAGFTFANGLPTPTQSFGPILTDRAETLGAKKLYLSLSYQHFEFDKADGVDLKNFGAVFTHEPEPTLCPGDPTCVNGEPLFTNDIIATENRIDLKVSQVTLVATYGLSDKIDLAAAVPVLNVRMGVQSRATIFNFEPPPVDHQFANAASPYDASFSNSGNSFGMGDVTFRTKYLARRGERYAIALGVDLRIPTGDAYNFTGAGTWGFRPFAVYSLRGRRISPHAGLGIQGNGSTVLAGDVTTDPVTKEHLPNLVNYSVGADASIAGKLGVSADFIGGVLLHASKVANSTFLDKAGNTHSDIRSSFSSVNLGSVAVGLKANVFSGFLIAANVLFRVNDAGLHAKPAPLVGISYLF